MMKINLRIPAIALMFLLASGCTTMQPLKEDMSREEIVNAIKPGDEVNIVTKSGDQHLIKVSSITEDNISGEKNEFEFEDIEKIELKKPTTAGKVAGYTAAAGIGYGVGVVISYLFISLLFAFS
jgi:hypothetical protein